jgi:uncharacterized protein YciI
MSVNPDAIQLDTYEMVLLRRTPQYWEFDEESRERIFGEHLGHTRSMVASGRQLVAGPLTDSPAEETQICGFGLFQQGSLEVVRSMMDADPGVQQGLYCFDVMTWRTPMGSVTFPSASTRAP